MELMKGIPMDHDQINYLRHRLERYEESIVETENNFDQLECFGRYRACAPYYEKNGIPLLINALETNGGESDRFWQEFDRITGKLAAFDTRRGRIYRDLLYNDLKNYVAAYHSALCYANLNIVRVDDHDLFNREEIRALLSELQNDYDTREIEILVTALDELFLQIRKPADEIFSKKSPVPEHPDYTYPVISNAHFLIRGENKPTRRF